MELYVHVDGNRYRVSVSNGRVLLDDRAVAISLGPSNASPIRVAHAAERSLRIHPGRVGRGEWRIDIEGVRYEARVLDPGQEAALVARGAAGGKKGPSPLTAPMPGLVVRVLVEEGDRVDPGDGLVIVEAMKMENELRAGEAGRVGRIHVQEGAVVEKDEPLVTFQPPEVADSPAASADPGGVV
jgi:biotin carboxyl carrier protein